MTLYSRANLTVAEVASRDEFDRGLCGVWLDPDGSTAAGDGRSGFMAVSPAGEVQGFPDVGEQVEVGEGGGKVLSVKFVKEATKNLPRDKRIALQHAAMTKCASDGRKVELTCVSAEGVERRIAAFPKRDAYPDWREVMRGAVREGGVRVCVNRRHLIDMLQAMERACPDRGDVNPVFLEIGKGVVMRSTNHDTGQRAVGCLSSYNTKGKWLERSEWEKGVFGRKVKKLKRKMVL